MTILGLFSVVVCIIPRLKPVSLVHVCMCVCGVVHTVCTCIYDQANECTWNDILDTKCTGYLISHLSGMLDHREDKVPSPLAGCYLI
jgi:hypothetical protein